MSKLRENIDRILGNSIRCLLPSYWWKRIFGLVVDEVEKKQNVIKDLATIRNGASKGATAIQSVKTINGESIEGEGDIVLNVDTSAIDEAISTLQNEIVKNEKVMAAALADLNKRVGAVDETISEAISEAITTTLNTEV